MSEIPDYEKAFIDVFPRRHYHFCIYCEGFYSCDTEWCQGLKVSVGCPICNRGDANIVSELDFYSSHRNNVDGTPNK